MKSYTDIEQSKKLAEILPIESADMFWMHVEEKSPKIDFWKVETIQRNFKPYSMNIPCWSLTALLEIIGKIRTVYERMVTIEVGKYAGNKWYVELVFVMTESKALMTYTKELIDACVEMIYKLKEKDLL